MDDPAQNIVYAPDGGEGDIKIKNPGAGKLAEPSNADVGPEKTGEGEEDVGHDHGKGKRHQRQVMPFQPHRWFGHDKGNEDGAEQAEGEIEEGGPMELDVQDGRGVGGP